MRLSGRNRLKPLDLFPALVLAASNVLARGLVSGDETGLFMLLLALTLSSFLSEEGRFAAGLGKARDLRSLLPALLLLAARPEAPLLLAMLWTWRLLARLSAWPGGTRMPWTSLAWLVLLPLFYGLSLTASYVLFASLWPAVITAREALKELRPGTPEAVAHAWKELAKAHASWGGGIPLLLAAVIGAGRAFNYWGRTALMALAGASLCSILLLVGADGGRLALPLILALLLLAAEGLEAVTRQLWPPTVPRLREVGGAALMLGLAGPVLLNAVIALKEPVKSELTLDRPLLEELKEVVIRQGWLPQSVSVLTSSPGTAARMGFQVLDASGLTDPSVRRYAGNRRPLELQQLVFDERRPDIIIEQRPWKAAHNLSHYPEAARLYFPFKPERRTRTRVSLARRLVQEYEPWPDRSMRIPLGKGLELLGVRVEPGHLVMLLTLTSRAHLPRKFSLSVGNNWSRTMPVGPEIYPVRFWRPGELVRWRIPLPERLALADQRIKAGVGKIKFIASLDLRPLMRDFESWLRDMVELRINQGDWDLSEVINMLTRRASVHEGKMPGRAMERIKKLQARGLIKPAIRQLELARRVYSGHPGLEALSRTLAGEAYKLSLEHIRSSRWTSAFRLLKVAAKADPASAWIARRLEEARRRMPAGSHLVEELELELARRALVLAPSVKNLERVLGAHLTLGRYQMVVAVSHTWKQRLTPSRRSQYLLAKALVKLGRLIDAQELVARLLDRPARSQLVRRCPQGVWPKLLLLQAEVLQQLTAKERGISTGGRFKGKAHKVGKHSHLFSYCASWKPGRPLEVDLYLWQEAPEELYLTLNVGSRHDRMVVNKSGQMVRLLRRSFHLPPASYPVHLQMEGEQPISLGTVEVGPESSFGFELPGYPGWKSYGTAFGRTPVVGRSFRVRKLFGYVGERYADSYHQVSDRPKGLLVSSPFLLRRSHLMMLVAGGSGKALGVDLLVDGKWKHTVRGRKSETLRLVLLPIGKYRGKMGQVVLRDRATGKWGHLAVDEIRQIDGPMPGVAP